MSSDIRITLHVCLMLAFFALGDAFFLRWGSEPVQVQGVSTGKGWAQAQSLQPPRYYGYEQRKVYSPFVEAAGGPIPISVPLSASLTPVALQHVQLVPCMCPVAPEEADKLMEAAPGPYLAQSAVAPQRPDQNPKH